ncbi:MAG: hypothetical protein AAGA54_14465 [Myxococcota bacterium]
MAEARLGPDELDRLEDALEGLEHLDDLSDSSPLVSARLADFKAILEASREALPLEDVPSGLLAGVIEEARMSPEDITVSVGEREATSLWQRLRKSLLLPGLAVAGSAALVLLIVQPTLSDGPVQAESGAIVADRSQPAPASPAKEFDKSAPAPEVAPAIAEPVEEELEEADGFLGRTVEEKPAATAAQPKAAEPPPPPAADPPATKADTRDSAQGWNAIEAGDDARKGGDCFTARNHYARALDDGNDSVRARAYVGLGLCKQLDGNDAAAGDFFRQARELDPDAADFAVTQAEEPKAKPSPRRPRKKRSASKRNKGKMNFDESVDPLQGL